MNKVDKAAQVLLGDYQLSVERMADYFLEKHGIEPYAKVWCGKGIGDVLDTVEYTIRFDDIETDLRLNAPKGMYLEFRDAEELHWINGGIKTMSYESYIRGLRFEDLNDGKEA